MIKHNGYYIIDPESVRDSIANYTFAGYSHIAFLFLENGTYLKLTKNSKNKNVSFLRGDFNYNYPNRYMLKNGDLLLTYHTGGEWEFSEVFKKKSEDRFKNASKI